MLYTGSMTGPVSLPFPPKDITSGFNPNRKVLINGKWVTHSHTGTDFAPSYKGGEPIPAILDGNLTGWGNNHSLYGNWAEYTGSGGWEFRVHGRKETSKPPQTVKAGDTVGTIYQPGASNGIHVHYELYKDGRAVDMTKIVGWNPDALYPRNTVTSSDVSKEVEMKFVQVEDGKIYLGLDGGFTLIRNTDELGVLQGIARAKPGEVVKLPEHQLHIANRYFWDIADAAVKRQSK